MKRPEAEVQLIALMTAYGAKTSLVEELIDEIKREAIEADHGYKQEATNLHNAKQETVEALQTVIYNLRNA